MPAYIQIATDHAMMPVVGIPIHVSPLLRCRRSPVAPEEIHAALTAITARLKAAHSPVILAAFTIGRYGLQSELEALLTATGIPFAATGMSKGMLSESHPLYLGQFNGESSLGDVRKIVEGADLVLDLGGVVYSDGETGGYSADLDSSKVITVYPDHVEIGSVAVTGGRGELTYGPVHIKDVLEALTKQAPTFTTPKFSRPASPFPAPGAPGDPVTDVSLFSRLEQFLESGDTVVADTGTCDLAATAMLLPDGVHSNMRFCGAVSVGGPPPRWGWPWPIPHAA